MRWPLVIGCWLGSIVLGWTMGVLRLRHRYIAVCAVVFALVTWAVLQFSQG